MKTCVKCLIEKPHSEYHKHPGTRDGFTNQCNKCAVAQTQKWRKANPDRVKAANFKQRYGISLVEYQVMYEQQKGLCAICGKKESSKVRAHPERALSVDHCHNTLQVRGLLCQQCNIGLGVFKDDTKLLQAAINYLES